MANVFDLVQGTAHVVAESSRLKATTAGHIYDLQMIEDTDNGTIVAIDDTIATTAGGFNGDEQVYKAKAYTAGAKPYFILTPPLAYNGQKVWSDEKYFYNAKDEIARAYELYVDDIFTLSEDAFTGAPAVGKFVDATYAVADTAGESGFVGQIMQVVNYTNSVSYRVRVISLGV